MQGILICYTTKCLFYYSSIGWGTFEVVYFIIKKGKQGQLDASLVTLEVCEKNHIRILLLPVNK